MIAVRSLCFFVCLLLSANLHAQAAPEISVPEGFIVETAAAPPLVKHPMMATFDDRGRLFIAESAGMNLRADELEKQLPNFIRILEDTDHDGVFDKSTIFADKLTLPMGALWHRDALYVASPPNIWKLQDTDGDGVADKREILVSEFGYTGNAASIHGCFLGPCGRIYWCDGRHGHEFRDEKGNVTSQGLAARIFSCNLDGSDVQVHCGGGMDNPVEITFTPEGEMLGTVAIFLSRPQRRDALVHWMYGGAYPHHPCVSEFQRTGDLLPPLSLFGQVAPSGVMRYRDQAFGPEYTDNIFIAQFNTHKVVRTVLQRSGATFQSQDEDFLVSPNIDFHPTDVLQDADGSLLVVDTGGWFRIGCPLSQIAKPNILGAIYRVRKKDSTTPADPRGLEVKFDSLPAAELARLLDDGRFTVRDRTLDELARRGDAALPALASALESSSARVRRNAVWSLSRLATPKALSLIRQAITDPEETVRLAAVHSIGVLRDGESVGRLSELAVVDTPPIRREAATALGRVGRSEGVAALLFSLTNPVDRLLEHAVIYAMIEIDDRQATLPGLTAVSPHVRKGTLIALDQMKHGELTPDLVTPLLDTSDLVLQQTALEVIGRHEGWASEIVQLLTRWLNEEKLSESQLGMARGALLAFVKEEPIQKLIGERLTDAASAPPIKQLLLEVIGRSGLEKMPLDWHKGIAQLLHHDADEAMRLYALQALATLASPAWDEQVTTLLTHADLSEATHLAVLKVVGPRLKELSSDSYQLLKSRLSYDTPTLERLAAAEILSKTPLADEQLLDLAAALSLAEPLELPALAQVYGRSRSEAVGKAFLQALEQAPGMTSLQASQLEQLLTNYPQSVRDAAAGLLERLKPDTAAQQARLAELQPYLAAGDAQAGKEIFFGKKAACFACHRVQGEGGLVGPELSKIGEVRNSQDLLEAIVFPSSSFVRGYESYSVATVDGSVHSGVLARESADALFLVDTQRVETRIARKDIDVMAPSKVSIMPQGFDRSLSPQELADLIAYLKTLK